MNYRGLLVFCFFLQVGGAEYGNAVDTKQKLSQFQKKNHEKPCLLNFTHPCKEMLGKIKGFVEKHLSRFKESFKFYEDASSASDEEEVILAESDQDDEEKTRKINEPPAPSSYSL